ncbi:TPA: hypothetical protein ACP7SO_005266, partial [Escherichia coli]|jgi:hypothetical protein
LKIYKYIYNKKNKSQRINPSQGKIKISPYSRFPIKEKRQNAEQVKILILACEGLTKRSAVGKSAQIAYVLPGTGNVCCSGSENTSPGRGFSFA